MMTIFKRVVLFGMFAAMASLVTAPAYAGAGSSLKPFVINELEDEDFESFLSGGVGDTMVPGDLFLGVLKIQQVNEILEGGGTNSLLNPGNEDATFTALFLIEVANIITTIDTVNNIFQTVVYFKPVEDTDWAGLTGLDLPNPVNPNTIAQFWDDVAFGDATEGTAGDLQGSIDSFVGLNKIWEFGFAGDDFSDDGISDLGEFFLATGAVGTQVVGNLSSTITNLINLSLLESFNGALPLMKHTFLSGDIDEQIAQLAGVSFSNATELQGRGVITSVAGSGAWQIRTDTDVYIYPIPEPSSLVLWGISALGLGLMAARRRKYSAALAA